MPAPIHAKVVIIGSGPAGYTAAIYAARAMLEPILIQGIQPGGQLTITTDVENYPGFADVIQGPWLMEQMEKQAAHVGTKIVTDLVTKLELAQRPFRLTCDSGDVYLAETVILATGAQARWLGMRLGRKVQGFRRLGLRDLRRVFLSRQGSRGGRRRQHRGRGSAVPDQFRLPSDDRASPRPFPRRAHPAGPAVQAPKIKVVWDSAIDEICGTENPSKVTHVRLKNVKTGALTEVTGRRRLHRDRPRPGDRSRGRPDQAETVGLCRGGAELDRDLGARPVRRGRRRRRNLPAGGHGRRPWLHGSP